MMHAKSCMEHMDVAIWRIDALIDNVAVVAVVVVSGCELPGEGDRVG